MNRTNQSARETQRFEGDVIINNDLVVGGELKVRGFIKAYGIKYVNKGLFLNEEALKEEWPEPQVGDWAFVGNELPWAIWACRTAGIWIDTGMTGGTDLDIPDIRRSLEDIKGNVDEIRLKITDIEELIGAGYRFIGIATPETEPVEVKEGTRAMYLAMTEGEYPHFGEGTIRLGNNDVALFLNAGKGWDCALLDIPRKMFVARELDDRQKKNFVIDFNDKDRVIERVHNAINEGREVYCNVLGSHFRLMDSRDSVVRFSGLRPVDEKIVFLEYNGGTDVWTAKYINFPKDEDLVHRKGQERIDGVKQFTDTAEFDGGLVTNDKIRVVNGIDVLPEMDGPDSGPKIIRFFDKYGHVKTLEEYLNGGAGGDSNFGLPRRIIKHKPFVYEAWFDSVDYELARKYVKDWVPSGCSSFINGREYARQYDWNYNNQASCVVHIGASAGRYSSDAVCSNLPGFEDKEGYEIPEELWKVIACRVLDGINSKGVIANVNVVPVEPGTDFEYAEPESGVYETEISAVMLPRFILDNFDSAKAAAAYIQEKCRVYMPDALRAMGYRPHFGITDKSGDLFIIEFVDGRVVVEAGRFRQMTNFVTAAVTPDADGIVYTPADVASGHSAIKENNIQAHGSGLERWNLIVRMRQAGARTEDICRALFYTRAYKPETDPYWHTEFTGEDMLGKDLTVDTLPAEFAEYEKAAQEHYQKRTRETGDTWHTTHSTIYDLDNGTMRVLFQEEGDYEQYNNPEEPEPTPVELSDTVIYSAVEMSDDAVRFVDDIQPDKNAEIIRAGRERFVRVILTLDELTYTLTAPIIAREPSVGELVFIAVLNVEDNQAIVMFATDAQTGYLTMGYAETYDIFEDVVKVTPQRFDEEQRMIARENLDLYRTDIRRYQRLYEWKGDIEGRQVVKTDTGMQYYYLGELPEGLDFGNLLHENAWLDGRMLTKDNTIVDGRGNLFIAPDYKTAQVLMQPEGAKNPCQYDLAGHTVELPAVGLWASAAFRLEYEEKQEIVHKVPEQYLPEIDAITRKEFEAEHQARVEAEVKIAMALIWQDFVEVGGDKVKISFFRGLKESLPQGKYTEGAFYMCTDTEELFFANTDSELIRIAGGGGGGGIPEAPVTGEMWARQDTMWKRVSSAFMQTDFANIADDAILNMAHGGVGAKNEWNLTIKELLNSIGSSQREITDGCRLVVQNAEDNNYRRTEVRQLFDANSATIEEIDKMFDN